ncbi:hypothetical protein ADK87_27000 [Streptomyces sp. NRRL F-4711]|uniref:hypothetical protein n=1 Tax=unclassified Streptomyces TaxID=2593676 RepID=UPI0004C1209E|nr:MULTISPECIES: hypothetical protein [unclassified Streptomyces]KOT95383.1 hypothetical protein ADK87_27000 [Streptomyces sp. NRRL F-4711]
MSDAGHDEVRDLLARAAEGAGPPSFGAAAVFAEASRVRRRRRAVVAGGVLALVAGALTTVSALPPGEAARPSALSSPSAPPEHTGLTGGSGREERLAVLLPAGAGEVEEVSWAVLLKGADLAGATSGESRGALDGEYAVHRPDGVGYLGVALRDQRYAGAKFPDEKDPAADLCARTGSGAPRADCVREELAGGRVLTVWRPSREREEGGVEWGEELTGRLALPDGRVLVVRDSAGYRGPGQLGPPLRTPPLTREQLRALMLRPELVAGR